MRNQLMPPAPAILLIMLVLAETSLTAEAKDQSSYGVLAPQLQLWLAIGASAGALWNKIIPGYPFALRARMGIGILGAVIGGYVLLPQLDFVADPTGANFIAGTVGAAIMLITIGLVRPQLCGRPDPAERPPGKPHTT
jgi:uncharacterized membrane protein YeaQ/YmgE (transglycosylase-associated protein family)